MCHALGNARREVGNLLVDIHQERVAGPATNLFDHRRGLPAQGKGDGPACSQRMRVHPCCRKTSRFQLQVRHRHLNELAHVLVEDHTLTHMIHVRAQHIVFAASVRVDVVHPAR